MITVPGHKRYPVQVRQVSCEGLRQPDHRRGSGSVECAISRLSSLLRLRVQQFTAGVTPRWRTLSACSAVRSFSRLRRPPLRSLKPCADFEPVKQIFLEENYRSTGAILGAALAVVKQGAILFSAHSAGAKTSTQTRNASTSLSKLPTPPAPPSSSTAHPTRTKKRRTLRRRSSTSSRTREDRSISATARSC